METPQAQSISQFLKISCDQVGENNLFTILEVDPQTNTTSLDSISGVHFKLQVEDLSQRQQISGINSSARVALIGESSIPWILNFFAALTNGAIVCPVDIKLTPTEISQVLEHFEATHVLTSATWHQRALQFTPVLNNVAKLISFEEFNEFPSALVRQINDPNIGSSDPSLILYTSGTSGTPKGVTINMTSLYFEAEVLKHCFPFSPDRRAVLSILPLNHLYGLMTGIFNNIWSGQETCFSQSLQPEHIQILFRQKKINRFIVVPLLLSLIKNGILLKVKSQPLLQRLIFRLFISVNSRLRSKIVAKVIFQKVREGFCNTLDFFVSGGAPLEKKTSDFFDAIGWPVYNGYGLTETGPVIAANSLFHKKNGSVGKPLTGVQVKIIRESPEDNDGEIWTRGPHLFSGYYKANDLTREVMTDDGWFKTGDLGFLDRQGFLYVTGRSKSMIVLLSGKKVQPEEIENLLGNCEYVNASCVMSLKGRGTTEKLVAVIELNDRHKYLIQNPDKLNKITTELKGLCQNLASFKIPQEFHYRKTPFELTSSQKIKRHVAQRELEENLI